MAPKYWTYDLQFTETPMTTWAMLRLTWLAVNRAAELRLTEVGLTPEKTAILWLCRDYQGEPNPTSMASAMFRENQTIVGLLNRLGKDGLVRRLPRRKGSRFVGAELTDKGKKVCDIGVEIYKEMITTLTSVLSEEEQEQLQKLLLVLREKTMEEMQVELETPACSGPDGLIPVEW